MDSFTTKLGQYWRKANQWFYRTADRALDEAYKAALNIKAIEDEHFGGEKIVIYPGATSERIAAYFQNDLNKYLNIARIRLAEFQTSRTITGSNFDRSLDSGFLSQHANSHNSDSVEIEYEARVLEKLRFIDEILTRYADNPSVSVPANSRQTTLGRQALEILAPTTDPETFDVDLAQPDNFTNNPNISIADPAPKPQKRRQSNLMNPRSEDNGTRKGKAIIDPSLIATFRRIQQDLSPQAETQVIENYRFHQGKTRSALRFILLMILVPLLVQFMSKIVIIGPAVDFYRSYSHADVFINTNLEREALEEMERFEKALKFKQIVGTLPQLTPAQMEAQIQEKAEEIKVNFYHKSAEAVKNWFADFLAILAFGWLITHSQQQINILKSFIDDVISGLSDTAKAFIIILLTDTFVGFHSPHGWEIILEGMAKHLGIPENREFNSLFIATVPVLLDTVFKYWIFRYLTGQSPSAVATFKTMNE